MQNFGKKLLWACIGVIAFVLVEYLAYYLVFYYFYDDYKDYKQEVVFEEGTEYTPLGTGAPFGDQFELAFEKNDYQLYIDQTTCAVVFYDKKSQQYISTNPIGTPDERAKNQLTVNYLADSATASMNSFDYVKKGAFTVSKLQDGIRVTYTLGKTTPMNEYAPVAITNSRFEEIKSLIEDEKKKKNLERYYLTDDNENNEYGKGYRQLINQIATGQQVTALRDLLSILDSIGYTVEDYEKDKEEYGFTENVKPCFTIPVDYRINGNSFEASIATKGISEKNGGQIISIDFMRFLGAASNTDEGYFVVPNASGSLINFNNGKSSTIYSQYVYGIDPLAADYTKVEKYEDARMPIFGICNKTTNSIFAEITSGASLAEIKASTSGYMNIKMNMAYTTFYLRNTEKLDMFGGSGNSSSMSIAENKIYDAKVAVNYTLMDEAHSDYSGMANYYRELLMARGVLKNDATAGDIGFYMDLIGSVKETDFFLGAQYLSVLPMTTFAQAGTIVDTLAAQGIKNQIVNYQGWFNGGYFHDVASTIKVVRKLGSKADFEDLSKKLEGLGGKLYGDVAFQKVTYISKHYSETNETARYYAGGVIGSFGLVNPINLRQTAALGYKENIYYLLSPKYLLRYVDKFTSRFADMDVTGVSLRDLGSTLISDKKRTEFINREEALDIVLGQLQIIADMKKQVMISSPNSYSWGFANDLINVATSYNPYFLVDLEIPFYQMVIHGCIDYAGTAINLDDDFNADETAIRLIEYGAAPHFTFTYENSSELKYTALNYYYSTTFENWKDDAVYIYNKVNEALSKVNGAYIIKHEVLQTGVKEVTYSNGVVFVINTNGKDVEVNGTKIPALSYIVK